MLSKEEEDKLNALSDFLSHEAKDQTRRYLTLSQQKWLTNKVRELNERLKILDSKSDLFMSLEDRELFNEAKKSLMDSFSLTEKQAYIFIQKTAMETRQTKIEVATGILREVTKC